WRAGARRARARSRSWHHREPADEVVELRVVARLVGDAPKVVDAAVLLQHHEHEVLFYAVEARAHLRAQGGATVELELSLVLQLPVGEADVQVLGQRAQRD